MGPEWRAEGGAGVEGRGWGRSGADDETRTRDIDLGKVALYQLSYVRRTRRLAASGRRTCYWMVRVGYARAAV